jgi:hypothetical protein
MLVACRLAGLSALKAHYADIGPRAQFGPTKPSRRPFALLAIQGSGRVFPWASAASPEALAGNAGAVGRDQGAIGAQRASQARHR